MSFAVCVFYGCLLHLPLAVASNFFGRLLHGPTTTTSPSGSRLPGRSQDELTTMRGRRLPDRSQDDLPTRTAKQHRLGVSCARLQYKGVVLVPTTWNGKRWPWAGSLIFD